MADAPPSTAPPPPPSLAPPAAPDASGESQRSPRGPPPGGMPQASPGFKHERRDREDRGHTDRGHRGDRDGNMKRRDFEDDRVTKYPVESLLGLDSVKTQHPLRHKWVLWYTHKTTSGRNNTNENYADRIRPVG